MIRQAAISYLRNNNFPSINPKAVFFDMDGILFDSMPNHAAAWVKAMNRSGLPFTHMEAYMFEGQPGADTVNHVYERIHGVKSSEDERTVIYKLKNKYFDELGKPKQMPFVNELLKAVKNGGYGIYVVTGSAHPTLTDNLQACFSGIFKKENIITAFDVKRGKPFPDPYLEALKRANVHPWEALVVENAPLGVRASNAAKIFTIAVNTGPLDNNMLTENGADVLYDNMEQLFNGWENLLTSIKPSSDR